MKKIRWFLLSLSVVILISLVCFYICLPTDKIHYIVSSNENEDYLSFWPYVKHNVEKLGMVPVLVYTGTDKPTKSLKGRVVHKPCPSNIESSNYARVIRLFAPSLFPDKYCVIGDIDSIPLRKKYFDAPAQSLRSSTKNGWVYWKCWSLGPSCKNWPMCFNLAKGRVWREVFPYAWDKTDGVIRQWINARTARKRQYFTDQYYFGKHFCRWKKNNPHRFKEYHQTIYNLLVGERGHIPSMKRRMKVHHIEFCETPAQILAVKHKSGVAWVSRPNKDGDGGEESIAFREKFREFENCNFYFYFTFCVLCFTFCVLCLEGYFLVLRYFAGELIAVGENPTQYMVWYDDSTRWEEESDLFREGEPKFGRATAWGVLGQFAPRRSGPKLSTTTQSKKYKIVIF